MRQFNGIRVTTGKFLLVVCLIVICNQKSEAQLLDWRELIERTEQESPKANHRFSYGQEELQFGDLWIPEGEGPHPVVIMIHGGCWLSSIPGVILMELISDDLRSKGIAVWNIEYRRVGNDGGGYPGTFLDVANGADYLRNIARDHNLDLSNVITVGHSAGGHLSLWLSGRKEIDQESELWVEDPIKIKAAISLAGIGDLVQFREYGNLVCGQGIINSLVDIENRSEEVAFSDTSPIKLVPDEIPQVLIHGVYDPIVPPFLGYSYKRIAERSGGNTTLKMILEAGHFELIAPWTDAWKEIVIEIEHHIQ